MSVRKQIKGKREAGERNREIGGWGDREKSDGGMERWGDRVIRDKKNNEGTQKPDGEMER